MTPTQRRRLFCTGLAGGLFAGCLVFQTRWDEVTRTMSALLWLTLLCGSVGAACYQTSRIGWAPGRGRVPSVVRWSLLGWLITAFAALAAWPHVDDPGAHPLRSWLALLSLFGLIYTWGDRWRFPGETAPYAEALPGRSDFPRSLHQAVVAGALAIGLLATLHYLRAITPNVGGVDFFYYVCNARDMLLWPDAFSPRAYSYFPGVYAFWRSAWLATGGSLVALQLAAVLLVVANGIVLGFVVFRACRSWSLGAIAGFWYLLLASRYQGFAGVTEPLATLPWLMGLALWQGATFRGSSGWARAVGVGIALGLTTYAKQQGGLLTLGAIAWWLERPGTSRETRHDGRQLLLIPLVAVTTLLIGVLGEGRGISPLLQGGHVVAAYAKEGTWLWNLYVQVRHDETAALYALLGTAAWVALYGSAWRYGRLDRPWLRMASFAMIAGAATLIQFRSRPYGHYALLGIPCLILVTTLCGHRLAHWYFFPARRQLIPRWLVAVAVTVPIFVGGRAGLHLQLWNLRKPLPSQANQLWHHDPKVADSVEQLAKLIPPGQTIYVLPPYRTELYFLLRGHGVAEFGYRFQVASPEEFPWDKFDGVIECHAEADTHPQRADHESDIGRFLAALPEQGFRVKYRTPAFTLWTRPE